jgi:hypothetical protein
MHVMIGLYCLIIKREAKVGSAFLAEKDKYKEKRGRARE